MLLEHLVYSTAIAIVLGTLYRRYTGRDHAWLVVASAYVPDLDIVADGLLQRIGITVMVHGSPIRHGYFHNAAVMLAAAPRALYRRAITPPVSTSPDERFSPHPPGTTGIYL